MPMINDTLQVKCKNCGSPAGFDIINQTYRCVHCGETSGVSEATQAAQWKRLDIRNNSQRVLQGKVLVCPGCGNRCYVSQGEATGTCEFCGNNLVKKDLVEGADVPELILPFVITENEAKDLLMKWANKNPKKKESRIIKGNIGLTEGYYLPYRLIRGPVEGNAYRDIHGKTYRYRGFLEKTAVATSKQLDNLVLNAMEPFDWTGLQEFELGYIGGHRVKLSDLSEAQIAEAVLSEVSEDYRPWVAKALQTSGVTLETENGDFMNVSALLPAYVLRVGDLLAVVNGQTGKVAVKSLKRPKEYKLWVIEPILITVLVTIAAGFFFKGDIEGIALSAAVVGIMTFAIYDSRKNSVFIKRLFKSENRKARRENGKLVIEKELKNPLSSKPVFYEKDGEREATVELRFYTVGRLLQMLLHMFTLVFAPAILAVAIRTVMYLSGNAPNIFEGIAFRYGAAWYVLGGAICFIYFLVGFRGDVYNRPIMRELLPDGKKKAFGSRKERRITIFSLLRIRKRDREPGEKLLKEEIGLLIGIAVIMLGSLAAMLD